MYNPSQETAALDRKDWIAGLEKGLAIIEAFDADHPRLTATQAGQRCAMTRTAASRYLKTLVHIGYAGTDGKLFWLMPRILKLGHAYLESARLPRLVQPYLQRITNGTDEIAYLAILDGAETVFVARSSNHRHMTSGYMPGARIQAQVTAAGMAIMSALDPAVTSDWLAQHELRAYTPYTVADKSKLLSELQQFRRQGWSLSEQQLELNYRGIAVPLLDRNNVVHGAMGVTIPINNEDVDHAIKRILPVLQDAAKALRNLI
jgi:IclR family pca regulon transcriptional regulator